MKKGLGQLNPKGGDGPNVWRNYYRKRFKLNKYDELPGEGGK